MGKSKKNGKNRKETQKKGEKAENPEEKRNFIENEARKNMEEKKNFLGNEGRKNIGMEKELEKQENEMENEEIKEDFGGELKENSAGKKQPETVEKKEIKERHIPINIVVLAVAAALLLGYALSVMFAPAKEISINDIRPKNDEKIPEITGILVKNKACRVCEQGHSFINVMKTNNLPIAIAELDVSQQEGKKIVSDFNITRVPVLLIVKNTVTEQHKITLLGGEKTLLSDALSKTAVDKLGFYILEEQNFDGKAHTTELANTSCINDKIITVDLFEDPYSPNNLKFKTQILEAREKFSDQNVAFNYNYLPTFSERLPPILKENAEYLAEALMCSADTGKFNSFEMLFLAEYCDANDNNKLDGNELEGCGSGQAKIPLPIETVDRLLEKAGISKALLSVCRNQRIPDYIESTRNKTAIFFVSTTPSVVLNCRYATHPKFLQEVICFIRPELEPCKKN